MNNLSYWLNKNNIILKVCDSWDANMDGESWSDRAASKYIIGKPIIGFICDDVTRMYVQSMLNMVRVIPHSTFREYRCDTPNTKRYMKMIVSPEENGIVRLTHTLLRSEPIGKTIHFKTKTTPIADEPANVKSAPLNGQHRPYHARCSLCNKVAIDNHGLWLEPEDIPNLNIARGDTLVKYGICPRCIKGMAFKAEHYSMPD